MREGSDLASQTPEQGVDSVEEVVNTNTATLPKVTYFVGSILRSCAMAPESVAKSSMKRHSAKACVRILVSIWLVTFNLGAKAMNNHS